MLSTTMEWMPHAACSTLKQSGPATTAIAARAAATSSAIVPPRKKAGS
jgi:hypothetical protein